MALHNRLTGIHQQYFFATAKAYGALLAESEQYRRYGQPVPPQINAELRRLEVEARGTLGPQLMNECHQVASSLGTQYDQQNRQNFQQQQQQIINDGVERGAKTLTRGMYGEDQGLDAKQFAAVRDGKKFKIDNRNPKFNKAAVEKALLSGSGKTFDQRVEDLEHLEQLLNLRKCTDYDEQRYQDALKRNNTTDAQVQMWAKHGFELLLQKRQAENSANEPDFDEVEPRDQYQRKAQLADSWMLHEHELPVSEEIDSSYLNSTYKDSDGNEQLTRQAELSRAWDQVEERENYGNE